MSNQNKTTRPAFHGSDIEKIEEYYGIPAGSIVRFAANVNPLGISETVKDNLKEHLDIISTYPDRDYKSLRAVIGGYCNVNPDHVVAGNGATELISLLISERKAKHALVIGPTYAEYERELSLTGGKISDYYLKEEADFKPDIEDIENTIRAYTKADDPVDFLILCNPNNPTSSAFTADELTDLIAMCGRHEIFVMIDETYVEFAPSIDEITAMPLTREFDNLMVLRGVSKFFAAPGLRLGYGVTSNTEFLSTLKKHQNPWALNSIGAYAGELMLKDQDYIKETRELISSERNRCLETIQGFRNAKVYPAYANFILVKILREDISSFDVFEAAVKQGMMIRDCSSFAGLPGEYIRFCIMSPEDNSRLLNVLKEILG